MGGKGKENGNGIRLDARGGDIEDSLLREGLDPARRGNLMLDGACMMAQVCDRDFALIEALR